MENWEYMDIIRRAADIKCSGNIQLTVEIVDSLLGNPITSKPIKALFGLAGLQHNEDFASILEVGPLSRFIDIGTLILAPVLYVEPSW